VDDELDLLTVIARMLERSGYAVHAFSDPRAALEHFKLCTDCSVVFTDIKMPGMTGPELVVYLKKIRPSLYVVLMTAFPVRKEEWRKVLPASEADGFIKKPFFMAELVNVMTDSGKQVAE